MDNSLGTGIQQAGDVELKQLYLVDTKNKNTHYNLLGIMVDFTVYEDIYKPFLSGYIALIESVNLISTLPILGGEQLVAEFVTPGLTKSKTCIFVVTSVNVREADDKTNMYTLELISYEGYIDLNTKVSSAHYGNTTELIKSVFTKFFKTSKLEVEASAGVIKFVSGYWSPLKVINYITSKALFPNNKISTPNFLFWQTSSGHKFRSLSSLFRQPPVIEYVFDKNPARTHLNDGTSTRNITREYATVKTLDFVYSQDYIKNMMSGAYNHRVFGVNLFNKTVNVSTYSILNDFSKTIHTDPFPLNTANISTSSGMHSFRNTFPNLFDNVNDISDDIYAKRLSLLAQLDTWTLNITVHGRTDIEAGMSCALWLNNFRSVDASDKFSADTYDKLYSGRYLITAIANRFTQAKHSMTMEIIKDSGHKDTTKK